jgi:MFS family permease
MLRFSDRVGKGLRTSPRDALLAASAGPNMRGLAFGLHRAMDNAGAVVGPVVAALLLASGMPLKEVFLWTIVPAVLCLALAFAISEPQVYAAPATVKQYNWRLGEMPPVFKRYLVVVAIFTLGNSSNMFLLLRARELGVAEAQVPLLWAAVSFVAMLFSTPLSALSDRWGRVRLLTAGYLAYGLFYLLMGGLSHDGSVLFVLFGFYGLFMAATEGVEKALVADLTPEGRQGTAFGWFNLTAGIMLLPASVLFGWLYQQFSPLSAFAFSGGCAVLAAILLTTWIRPDHRLDRGQGLGRS